MFRLLSICLLVFLPLTTTQATILLQQNFTSMTFPPPGWVSLYTGSGAWWFWSDSDPYNGGYGHGSWSSLGGPNPSDGIARLLTYNLLLSPGQLCVIRFKRRCLRFNTYSYYYQVALQGDNGIIWSQYFTDTPSWTLTNCTSTAIPSGSPNYRIVWEVHGAQSAWNAGYVYFDVDDVTVFSSAVGVEATSLGRIKADFK